MTSAPCFDLAATAFDVTSETVGGVGLPGLRRDGDHPQPTRAGAADAAAVSGPVGVTRPASGPRRAGGRGDHAGQLDRHLGLHIPKGGIVQMLSHSAGTDPAAMPDPSFDITQVRLAHMGFGSGVHHCLGHFVARTDMSVALPLLAARMPDAQPDGDGVWLPVSGNTGAVRFPLRFTAAAL